MTDLTRRPADDTLIAALRDLGPEIDWPTAATVPDLATRVRVELVERQARPARQGWRPARRGLVLAVGLLLALVAVASALTLGLPGLRLILGDPPATPPPATVRPAASSTATNDPGSAAPTTGATESGPPGSGLGLGRPVELGRAEDAVGRPIQLPTDPALGPPDEIYVDPTKRDAVALVWAADGELPATTEPGIGLILVAFDGLTESEWYTKIIGSDTRLERVVVDGRPGYWISGDAHFFYVIDTDRRVIEDSRRWVGDTLVWSDGMVTYRLESGLGRDAAIRIAESLE